MKKKKQHIELNDTLFSHSNCVLWMYILYRKYLILIQEKKCNEKKLHEW